MPPARVTSPSQWAAVCSDAFVPLAVRSTTPSFSATLVQRRLSDTVALTRVASGPSQVVRDREIIAASPRENVLISLHRSGTGNVTQSGRSVALAPGTATMYDTSSPYVLDFPGRMSEIVLQLPRDTVSKTGNAFSDLTARPLPAGAGLRMLHALAAASSSSYEQPLDLELDALTEALTSLAATAISGIRAAPVETSVLLLSMRTYIGDHFADVRLTPEVVASAHHVSLRFAQKLFEHGGDSLAACIRRTRLEEARKLLEAGARVYTAAHRSGYDDLDSFSRAFKRHYGVTPSSSRPASA
ncbi:helix-turn-helix domain-containing protein [Microbacterium sp. cx-59]|uniref:helix-turn-helix domain-containing protein n=1 Tax=Microbacterium sp. cx-59 TaxID=2891207 RepID=UPI001E389239|nr:helix-turn-helix domain-containing protein [Microbacterium sp. cx-59]MCC4909157.1 helix-turn-helix domain-containing protein [Microbacterium sp. cx-59]